MAAPIRNVAQGGGRADALFIPDGGDALPDVVQALAANGVNTKKIQLLGTGLWDDPRVYSVPALDGGWFAAPDRRRLPQLRASVIAPVTSRTRCAPRRSPMTRSR